MLTPEVQEEDKNPRLVLNQSIISELRMAPDLLNAGCGDMVGELRSKLDSKLLLKLLVRICACTI
jgi:glycerol dehydrogenase-like iron-containing ADH family enzyme